MRHSNISRAERRSTPLEEWSGTSDGGLPGRLQFHIKKVVIGCQRSEELSCHDTLMRHLRGGDSWNHRLSGKRISFDT